MNRGSQALFQDLTQLWESQAALQDGTSLAATEYIPQIVPESDFMMAPVPKLVGNTLK